MNRQFLKLTLDVARRRDLTSTDKIVLAVIMDRIGKNVRCWPGMRILATDAGVDKNTVVKAVEHLKKTGDLIVERTGHGKKNYYYLADKIVRETHTASVLETHTVEKEGCMRNSDTGVRASHTEPYEKRIHIQREPLTRTTIRATGKNKPDPTQENKPKPQEVFDHWNLKAKGTSVPNAKTLNHVRRKQINTRLKDPDFARDFKAIIDRIYRSEFLMGKNGTWSITFDWFIKNDANWLKIHEGNYDNEGDQEDDDGPPIRVPTQEELKAWGWNTDDSTPQEVTA